MTAEPDPFGLTDTVYTVKETAKVLKLEHEKVYRLVKEGRLDAIFIGTRNIRITREALVRYLRNGHLEKR